MNTYALAQDFFKYYNEEVKEKLLEKEFEEENLQSLENLDKFSERIQMVKDKQIEEQLLRNTENNFNNLEKDPKEEDKYNDKEENTGSVDTMISFCEKYLKEVSDDNQAYASGLSDKLKVAYDAGQRREKEDNFLKEWNETGVRPNSMKLWNILNIKDPDNSIYFDIAAAFLEDCKDHLGEYLSHQKNLLLDTWYCTNTEDKYFHYVASKHQEKNEINSLKLLERISDIQRQLTENNGADSNSIVKNHPLTKQLLNEQKQKEEDAKCSICGSGDYEENDLIVF